jgi:hypothetical protein
MLTGLSSLMGSRIRVCEKSVVRWRPPILRDVYGAMETIVFRPATAGTRGRGFPFKETSSPSRSRGNPDISGLVESQGSRWPPASAGGRWVA